VTSRSHSRPTGASARRPTLAVFKFASCDGCQLGILDVEDLLLDVAATVDIVNFPEASSRVLPGPYDIGLVEGSITTDHDRERLLEIRRQCRTLVAIGACATSGGIQALRNASSVDELAAIVYPHPEYFETLETSTPIAEHVDVDLEVPGCPVDGRGLVGILVAVLAGRRPDLPEHSVCIECKRLGRTCVIVAGGRPCLGPLTRAGCGALCPAYHRGCFGCYGPAATVNAESLAARFGEFDRETIRAGLRKFTVGSPEFEEAVEHV
jgi:coenzyme F420-reducing hydrogenase gamma subunit